MIATEPIRPWHGAGSQVRGHGATVLGDLGIPAVPNPGLLAQALSPVVAADPFASGLNAGLRSLLGAIWSRDPRQAQRAGDRLVGLGAGSTPIGDDYLLGVMWGVQVMGAATGFENPARERWLRALIPPDASRRTSHTSAALLAAGSLGRAPRVVHGILAPGARNLGSALGGVVALGASSGRGCAAAVGAAALLLGETSTWRDSVSRT